MARRINLDAQARYLWTAATTARGYGRADLGAELEKLANKVLDGEAGEYSIDLALEGGGRR